jgi:acetoin utilization deacetylase AcuC-like enzyme
MGFCIFNNVVIAALHARTLNAGIQRIAIVDYDVHHGNGTQDAFWNDPEALFISIHQDNNYPQGMGFISETGGAGAEGTTINIPLPPGSGTGAYYYTFNQVVIPALKKFRPDLILVSSGFDASYADPLGSMMLSSEAFGSIANQLIEAADTLCSGRILFAHEGGYSKDYVPFCGLAVIEALSGVKSGVEDPYLKEVKKWGYQDCQPHQAAVVDAVAAILDLNTAAAATTTDAAASASAAVNGTATTAAAVTSGSSPTVLQSLQEKVAVKAIHGILSGISDVGRRKAVLAAALEQLSE